MKCSNKFLSMSYLLLIAFSSNISVAQQLGCEDGSDFRAFDFWLGEWDVTDNVSGNVAGSNSIKKMEGGCMLLEAWVGGSGGSGTSINYYNPVNKEWRQLWVAQGRYSIDIAGGLVGESMQLLGSIYYFSGSEASFRGTWTPSSDGSVRQFFELYNEDTKSWDVWFDGRYVRKQL